MTLTDAKLLPQGRACAPVPPEALTLPAEHTIFDDTPNVMIENERALDRFSDRVLSFLRGIDKGHLRIALYGDSNMTMDFVSGGLRRMLQKKYGDAGHGFVALSRPWNWYRHMDVRHELWEDKWTPLATSTHPTRDGHYGLANMAAETVMPGAWASVATASEAAPVGRSVSNVDVFYMARPNGGAFKVKVDGKEEALVRGDSSVSEARKHSFTMKDGPHKVEVVSTRAGIRMFGAVFERDVPGFVVDSLGVGALNYEQFLHVSKESRDPMLKARNYDLVVFMLGTNMFAYHMHEQWLKDVLASYRSVLPNAAFLVAGAPDMEKERGAQKSDPRIAKVNAQFRTVALAQGAAYWDTRAAMGGDASMRRFARAGLAEADLIHFRKEGGLAMGERLGHALLQSIETRLTFDAVAGCTP
ncbi:MAG: hypothetical protein U0174_12415 [Polyangiaceae bacterium]